MLENHMNESKVYEIGYLLIPSIPQEKIADEVSRLSGILAAQSAETVSDEAPALIPLAYEMRKSSGSGTHKRYTEGYFGWMKFSAAPSAAEAVRKAFEDAPNMLRVLMISTVREKTYLGKRAKPEARASARAEEGQAARPAEAAPSAPAAPAMTQADIAAVDKKLDEMVKGA
jgi:ribosomal protein S6